MNGENYFIDTFRSARTPIGDDGAIVGEWVYSKDLFFENVHFKREWLSLYQIGYKAMLVNLSDAVAMNAVPRFALLGAALPKTIRFAQMQELSRGIRDAAERYGVEIIGGDTIGNVKLDLSVTIVSSRGKKPLRRRGMKPGDWIAHTGTVGNSAKELRYLMAGGKIHSRSRFAIPTLRQPFVQKASRYLRCGMDISDGIFSDLGKLCNANGLGMRWEIPLSKRVGCSGEEYEMLIAFSPRHARSIRRRAALTRTPLRIIGRACRGGFAHRCKAHHF